jgi:hypothetical protein
MEHTREAIGPNLAERVGWEGARRDDTRVARRLYRTQLIAGIYRLDEGALLDDFFRFLQALGVMDWLAQVHGPPSNGRCALLSSIACSTG